MSRPLSIVLIDDHPIIRLGLVQALRQEGDFTIVGEGGTISEAITLVGEREPDVLLVDAAFSADLGQIVEVVAARPSMRVVILTDRHEDRAETGRLHSGVFYFALRAMTGSKLREAIRNSYKCDSPILSSEVLLRGSGRDAKSEIDRSVLSKKEVQVLLLVATGLNNQEVARKLNVALRTVKCHMTSILSKLSVRNRVEASILARQMWPDISN